MILKLLSELLRTVSIMVREGTFVKQMLRYGVISLDHVKSKRNLADFLTKGLSRRLVLDSSKGMGLKPYV